jgi:hypothetical protein
MSCRCIEWFLTLAQPECDSDTTALLVIYSVQKHERYLYELQAIWYLWWAIFQ